MIPKRYENAVYADVPQHVKEIFEKINTTRRGMYIYGGVGTGKTHMAYALKKYWDSKTSNPSEFYNTTELLQDIKDDFDRDNYSKTRVLERIMDSKRLIFLDDIGVEKVTDWVLERFYLIINKRYNDMMPLIFTSNLSPAELADKIGERAVSRIVELCDIVKVDGIDRRIPR